MKESTKKNVRGIGKFLGAAAYGFTHTPMIVAKDLKEKGKRKSKKQNKKEDA